jgi:hypothetical protein
LRGATRIIPLAPAVPIPYRWTILRTLNQRAPLVKRLPGPGLGRSLVAVAVVLAPMACAAGSGSTPDPFAGGSGGATSSQESRQIRIEVQNSNFNEARIEAVPRSRYSGDVRGTGFRRRLGRVPGNRSQVFTLDWTTAAPLYFEIDILAGGSCTTRGIEVAGGQTVRVVIDSVRRIRADGVSRICDAQRVR